MADLAKKVEPRVLSKANPERDWLLQARADIQNPDNRLQEFFQQARAEGRDAEWLAGHVGLRLSAMWEGDHFKDAMEAARYLADEFFQLPESALLMVSSETGKVVAVIDEDDIYQPAPVPREGGGMAIPLPRLRPELEAFITSWQFERGREKRIVETLAKRGHQTALLREEGDPRLLAATRGGRRRIVDGISQNTTYSLLRLAGGSSGAFLRHFSLQSEAPASEEGLLLIEGAATAKSIMRMQDPTTLNLAHNRSGSLQGALIQGWVREIARAMAVEAHRGPAIPPVPVGDLRLDDLGGAQFWVASPDTWQALKAVDPGCQILVVEGARPTGLRRKGNESLGVIWPEPRMEAYSAERFDRWEASAVLNYKMWVEPAALVKLEITDIEFQTEVVG